MRTRRLVGAPTRFRTAGRRVAAWFLPVMLIAGALAPPPAGAGTVEVRGHGLGHGRGLGQFGALGYAVDHGWTASQIADHFFHGTESAQLSPANPTIGVRLVAHDGAPLTVMRDAGPALVFADGVEVARPAVSTRAVRITLVAPGRFSISDADGCAGPFTPWGEIDAVALTLRSPDDPGDDRDKMLQACRYDAGGNPVKTIWYRGALRATAAADGAQRAVNDVAIEEYLRGVVPREMPSDWADQGGGAGLEALKAQAVAARSYAASEDRYAYAQTCDTNACQVYGGHADSSYDPPVRERSATDLAILDTAGVVRVWPDKASLGAAATEFSSSSGGYTAGGSFASVPDLGDDVSLNPNHDWTATITTAAVEARYGHTGLQSIAVTRRNGLGDDGGRALEVRIEFSSGIVTTTGPAFRAALGLKSDWFVPGPVCEGDASTDPFPDIACSVHYASIVELHDRDIARGHEDGTYQPLGNVTRAQMATFIAKAIGLDHGQPDPANPFPDIDGSLHRRSILLVAEAGIARGFADGSFGPGLDVSRAQMATFMKRAFTLPDADPAKPTFSDISGGVHEASIEALAASGITRGYPDATFRPDASVSRGQMATFLIGGLRLAS